MPITVVGLGPGAPGDLTVEAGRVLAEAGEVYLRTARHPTVAHLPAGPRLESFDHFYEELPTFDAVYGAIVERVLALGARPEGVVYAVPGHPLVGEQTVRQILRRAREAGEPVRLVPGLSFLDAVFAALGLDPLEQGLQVVDAHDPEVDPARPALVCQVYHRRVASTLKLALLEIYPPDHPCRLVAAAGVPGEERLLDVELAELDRRTEAIDHLTCVYLPPLSLERNVRAWSGLVGIVARLRSPDGGCPWDREQTHASLKEFLTEEAYETLEALDEGEPARLCEELGDLLLQILLHAQIARDAGTFDVRDVLGALGTKLIRRHPHVFGEVQVSGASEVVVNWEALKRKEREEGTSALAGIPRALPALVYAQKLQNRASRAGFDWRDLSGAWGKLVEEVEEFGQAGDPAARLHELGDLLLALVVVARWHDLDPEEALRLAGGRFRTRFTWMENQLRARDQTFRDLPVEEKRALWREAKAAT